MKAVALVLHRVVLEEDAFAEIALWRVPRPVEPSTRGYKCRLAYVVAGKCVVLYDNERGKGDHRHFGRAERSYAFSSPGKLMADFRADIERWNRENRRS
ncbi:MAG: hypothetical protein IPP91_10100 [Betaproteobacteria bacterium]|nr:hypothetical protein [Betaproteobacteria bacterium]